MSTDIIPNEQAVIVSQRIVAALNAITLSHIELARSCYELEQVVGHNNFNLVARQLLPDVSADYLRRHLNLWTKIKAHRQVTEWAGQNFSKALALVQAIDEEELAAIDKGTSSITLDEVDKLSVKQLKQRLRKLEHDKDKVVEEETKALVAERDSLIQKVNQIQTAPAAITSQLQQLGEAVQQLKEIVLTTADIVADDQRGVAQELAGSEVEAAVTSLRGQIDTIWQLWVERTHHA